MSDAWMRPVEQIVLSATAKGYRTIAFTSPEARSGVSSVASAVAAVFARSGYKTILIDLAQPVRDAADLPAWLPGEGDARRWILRHSEGFDLLQVRPTPATHFAFNNVARLRSALADELADYARIVIDLPPTAQARKEQINPLGAAAASDSVFLVYVSGRLKQSQLRNAIELIQSAGANLSGTILNEIGYATPGAEIARTARRWFRFLPRLAAWIGRRMLASELLN